MGPAENRDFLRGPRFFVPIKWHKAPAECHFGAQKIEGPSKRRDFLQGPILKPITGPILWFGRVDFTKQARFTAQEHWSFNATCSNNFRRVFFDFWSFWYPPPSIFDFCPVLYIWLFLEEDVGGGELSYLILTIFGPISVNAEHCKFTTRRFESKRRVVNLHCSALTEMGPNHTPPHILFNK